MTTLKLHAGSDDSTSGKRKPIRLNSCTRTQCEVLLTAVHDSVVSVPVGQWTTARLEYSCQTSRHGSKEPYW